MATKIKDYGVGQITEEEDPPVNMYPLLPGINRVDVTFPENTMATVTPKSTKDPNNTDKLGPVVVNGEPLVITTTHQFQIIGPGWLCFQVTNLVGSNPIAPIDVFITR